LGQQQGRGGADAGARTGDESNFAVCHGNGLVGLKKLIVE
jgi:hypothetical protein